MVQSRFAINNLSLEPFDSSADSVVVADGIIQDVGPWSQISNSIDNSVPVFDGGGCTLLPGIDDSHLHGYMLGRQLTGANVSPAECKSMQSIREKLLEHSKVTTGWIRGFGWVSGVVKGSGPEGTPSKADLEPSGIQRPIFLTDFSGHQAWVNQATLDAAGVTRSTPDPVGGVIVRDASGEPTGLLLEAAVKLATSAMPNPSKAELKEALTIATDLLISNGVTSFTDPGIGPGAASLDDGTASLDVLDVYRQMADSGEFHQRVDVMLLFGGLGGTTIDDVRDGLSAFGGPIKSKIDRQISVAQLKVFADGIPRSRTAWMSEPYDNHQHGSLTVAGDTDSERAETLKQIYQYATQAGWQVGIHATGDESVSTILNIAEANPGAKSLRNYIIHADLVKFTDFQRIAKAGLGLNMQPSIRWAVGRNVESILGSERFTKRLQLRQIAESNINFALSSDAPVSPADWKTIIATAVDRSFKSDTNYKDNQGLSVAEALKAMTYSAAYQSHSENWRGRVASGYAADFVLLDQKIDFNADPWSMATAKPRAVCVAGQVKFGAM
jgi:predicted amidohydrolase YtcJ